MKKQIKKSVLHKEHLGVRYVSPVIIIILLLAGVLGALLLNTAGLRNSLWENTVNYAKDVSAQFGSNISYRMKTKETYLRNLADTFSGMPEFLLTEELLERKAEYLKMNEIFVVNADDTTIPANREHSGLNRYLEGHPELYTESGIFFAECGEVHFSAPIIRENGENSLLIGTRSHEMLQQMLQSVDFRDQGLCCIVDKDGSVIVSDTDEAPFLELKDIFKENTAKAEASEAQKVLEDISARRSGAVQLSSAEGETFLLGYDFLGINDWMLLTLVTADLFSENITPYSIRYIVITGFLFLVMLAILFFVVWYYHRTLGHIQRTVLTDHLTGGHNELAFRIDCENHLREHPENGYTVIYLNIQNFKQFNESFGVKYGDELLRQIYRILHDSLQEGELLSRNAGDHFFLLLECADEESAQKRLRAIMECLNRHLSEQFSFAQISFDQGAYLIREQDTDFMILLDRAKVASSYQQEKDTCRFYDDDLSRQLEKEHILDASFRKSIENREFKLYIQPKVSSGKNTVRNGEVLIRWQHPEFGLLFPGEFIPLFERSGKICDLDFYVFEETCRLMRDWLDKGYDMCLSVNLSRAHLLSADLSFLDDFRRLKELYRIPDGRIELELTESLMLDRHDICLVTEVTDIIREMGFLCSIDDFGFGYSSLTMLKDMNATTVKLDRQFFLDESEKAWMVVKQLVQLIHNLGMTVVAEGIENYDQVEKLQEYGCDLIQGYVYAKPMEVTVFEQWIGLR